MVFTFPRPMFHMGLYRGKPSLREFVLPRSSLRHLYWIRQTSSPVPFLSNVVSRVNCSSIRNCTAGRVLVNIFPPSFVYLFVKQNTSHFPNHLIGQASPRFSHETFF